MRADERGRSRTARQCAHQLPSGDLPDLPGNDGHAKEHRNDHQGDGYRRSDLFEHETVRLGATSAATAVRDRASGGHAVRH
ncbi:hypothetical protein OG762_07905 [Streptomyces sp. NBC_01136]|uniref:hypothetical protein n=1 Tax=unclassified Streptomyces TaxID=2593676 RepID=UPI0032501828|nr:hypothetical protein OG762_07905 [Streptomyces sp. NBC_01136]